MKCYVALGSNQGKKRDQLEAAAQKLQLLGSSLKASPTFITPALVPPGAPEFWRQSYLNAVVEMEWPHDAETLLQQLKKIEMEMGRQPSEKWAPRPIDLDLLIFEKQIINHFNLQVPHPEITRRSFVLGPLKHLCPNLILPGHFESILKQSRNLDPTPVWMDILNVTPDSFSDGGTWVDLQKIENKMHLCDQHGIGILDLGAESTRPHAQPLCAEAELARLKPALDLFHKKFHRQIFKPLLSVDTRHAETAAAAVENGAGLINDVSAATNDALLEVVRHSKCDYVLMHSLSVPADPQNTMPLSCDPVQEIRQWAELQIEKLLKRGLSLDRVIFDPGLGFGKTADQSWILLRRLHEFFDLPVRILVGHSRKSFIQKLSTAPAAERDWESVGLSVSLAQKGVDILRVHEAHRHARTHLAFLAAQESIF